MAIRNILKNLRKSGKQKIAIVINCFSSKGNDEENVHWLTIKQMKLLKNSFNKNDWKKNYTKKFEKNNLTIGLNVLYAKKEKNICPAYVSKLNSNHEKQVILLIISNIEGWY